MTTRKNADETLISPALDLEQIRKECIELVKKRAWISAGAAVVPVPFLDVVIDVSILSVLLPKINAKFGLEPEQIAVYDPKTRQVHWNALRKRGVAFAGLVTTRAVARKSLSGFAGKILTKQVTKFVPLGGQIVAASLGYYILKKIALTHVEDSYKLAKQMQSQQRTSASH
ncbi:hypothetical protein ACF3NA_08570 [Alkanindiges sp. WGS2144]|uniref:hypothetical protein n=1 Tax=Alkanindiges sp. WGS2144 TaxID=3366808 RepID=UPI0037517713